MGTRLLYLNNNNKIQPIIGMQVLSVNKEYSVKRHYTTMQEEKYKKQIGEAGKVIEATYKKKVMQQVFVQMSKVNTENYQCLDVFYKIALQLVNTKKPFGDGVYVKNMYLHR